MNNEVEFETEVLDAPEQGTDKWLAWRKLGITATEAGKIMSPYRGGPLKIYTDKLGLTESSQDDTDGYMEWGHRIEPLLVDKFMSEHPSFTRCTSGRLYQRDWCKCSLDAQCYDENGDPVIIECKTGQDSSKWDPIPPNYYAQVQWQMYVTGIHRAFFSVVIRGHQWFEREVLYSPIYVEKMLEKCKHVWDCIQNRTPPAELSDFESDKEAIAALAGESEHSGKPVDVTLEEVQEYQRLKQAYEQAENEFQTFKNAMAYRMVDAPKLTHDGATFASWVNKKGGDSIDKVKLMNKHPDAYRDCLKKGKDTRYVRFATIK